MVDQWLPGQPYALELCRELGRHVELTLAAPRYYRAQSEPFRTKAVLESKVKEQKLGLARYFRGLLWLYGAALFGRYDVIHIQAFKKWQFEMRAYAWARRFGRKKLVYTAHNILPHEHGGDQREANALRRWYRLCDAIIVHNESSRQVLLGFEPSVADKVQVIPHGSFSDYAGSVGETAHEKTVFLQFGAIRKYKGIDILLEAASLLPEEIRQQVRIVIVGNQRRELDDTDYEALLARWQVQDCVELIRRFIPDGELPAYFNGCDCCLFPYKNIYGSGALLLAYTFGKPVIASAIPTFVEETDGGKTGLLCEPMNPRALADAITRFSALSGAERAAMKAHIRTLCENKYNWAVSAAALAEVYRRCLR